MTTPSALSPDAVIAALEQRVRRLETYVWVVLTVAGVFGITGVYLRQLATDALDTAARAETRANNAESVLAASSRRGYRKGQRVCATGSRSDACGTTGAGDRRPD